MVDQMSSQFTPFILIFVLYLFVIVYAQYLTRIISLFSGNLPLDVLCARSLSCQHPARRRLSELWLWIVTSMFTATGVRSVVCTLKPCQAGVDRPLEPGFHKHSNYSTWDSLKCLSSKDLGFRSYRRT